MTGSCQQELLGREGADPFPCVRSLHKETTDCRIILRKVIKMAVPLDQLYTTCGCQ